MTARAFQEAEALRMLLIGRGVQPVPDRILAAGLIINAAVKTSRIEADGVATLGTFAISTFFEGSRWSASRKRSFHNEGKFFGTTSAG